MIRTMKTTDGNSVLAIYEQGIDSKNSTFETKVPEWNEFYNGKLAFSRIVYEQDSFIIGWAALSATSKRKAYTGVAEVSIYIDSKHFQKGIGKQLLTRLIEISEQEEIWTLTAGIFAENKASIVLHEHCGFRFVGRRERIAKLDNRWRDTVLYERRSTVVGTTNIKK